MEQSQNPTQEPILSPIPVSAQSTNRNWLIIISIIIMLLLSLSAFFYLQNQKLKKQVFNQKVNSTIQAPSPTPRSASSISIPPDETANWKTYTSTKLSLSFKYPNGLFVGEDPTFQLQMGESKSEVGNHPNDAIYAPFTIHQYSKNDQFIQPENYIGSFIKKTMKIKQIIIDGKPATQYSGDYSNYFARNDYHSDVIVDMEDMYLYISHQFVSPIITKNVFDQILSTFKFL